MNNSDISLRLLVFQPHSPHGRFPLTRVCHIHPRTPAVSMNAYPEYSSYGICTYTELNSFFSLSYPPFNLSSLLYLQKICLHFSSLYFFLFSSFFSSFSFPCYPSHLNIPFHLICYVFWSLFTLLVSHTRETMWFCTYLFNLFHLRVWPQGASN